MYQVAQRGTFTPFIFRVVQVYTTRKNLIASTKIPFLLFHVVLMCTMWQTTIEICHIVSICTTWSANGTNMYVI